MRKLFLTIACLSWAIVSYSAPKDSTRYDRLDGTKGGELWQTLADITCVGYHDLTYAGLWAAFKTTDCYPGTNEIWDIYSDCGFTYSQDQCGNYNKECDCYNREHSIPKSWFGGRESKPGSDLFHIYPTDGWVNNKRGNFAYGEVSTASYTSGNGSKLGTSAISGISEDVFEPLNEYKGDLARGFLGTLVHWADSYSFRQESSAKFVFSDDYSSGGYGLTKYGIELLMKWHREDPVSEKEVLRNDAIEATQGNRNPFIDYPYLAEYFWGVKKGEEVELGFLMSSYDEDFVLGESDGHREGWVKPGQDEEGVEQVENEGFAVGRKYILDGCVLIEVNGRRYDILGQQR